MKHYAEDLMRYGYLRVTPDPAMRAALELTRQTALAFAESSPEVKGAYAMPDRREGYRAIGSEYSATEDRPDLAETFSCSSCNQNVMAKSPAGVGRDLYDRMLQLTPHFATLAETIANDIRRSLTGQPPRRFDIEGWSRLQMNCTHPATAGREILHDRHEDGDLFTITYVTAPGLEIETDEGTWQSLWQEDQLLVMPGETLWLITGGAIAPRYHRVCVSDVPTRLAFLYFADLAPHASEAWVLNDLNRGMDIGSRLFTNSARYGVPPVRDRIESHSSE